MLVARHAGTATNAYRKRPNEGRDGVFRVFEPEEAWNCQPQSGCHALPAVDHEAGAGRIAKLPADALGRARRANATAVHAKQMAPGAHRRHVLVFVAASRRAELEVMGRYISPGAHGAAALVTVADVDVVVCDARAQKMAPGLPER